MRKTRLFFTLALILIACSIGFSQEWEILPTTTVPHMKTPPIIDGNIDYLEWKDATVLDGFWSNTGGARADRDTKVYLKWDQDNLYVGFICLDPGGAERIKGGETRRDGMVWQSESVELFLDPGQTGIRYYHLMVNPGGAQYDEIVKDRGGSRDVTWDGFWEVKTSNQEDSWYAEFKLPFSSFTNDLDAASWDSWGVNFARNSIKGKVRFSSWACTMGGFHNPERFGTIEGLNVDWNHYACQVIPELPEDPVFGFNVYNFLIASKDKEQESILLETGIVGGDNKQVFVVNNLSAEAEREIKAAFGFNQAGKYRLWVRLMDSNHRLIYQGFTKKFEIPQIMTVKLIKPAYRNTAYLKEDDVFQAKLESNLNVSERKFGNYQLKATIQNEDGTIVQSSVWDFTKRQEEISIDILDPGTRFKLILELWDAQKLVDEKQMELARVSAKENQVILDEEGFLVKGGERFFPIGIYSVSDSANFPLLKNAGFNLVHSYVFEGKSGNEIVENYLDKAYEAGLTAFIGFNRKEIKSGSTQEVTERIKRLRAHPGLLAWYIFDEPDMQGQSYDMIHKIYEEISAHDPYHPGILVPGFPQNTAALIAATDIIMPDIYPVPGSIKRVSHEMDVVNSALLPGKGAWVVIQTHDTGLYWQLPKATGRPNYEQICAMVYQAIIADAKGITFYVFDDGVCSIDPRKEPEYWEAVCQVVEELNALVPILLTDRQAVSEIQVDGAIENNIFVYDGYYYLVAVNAGEEVQKLEAKFDGNVRSIEEVFDREIPTLEQGFLRTQLQPLECRVYKIFLD